MIQGSPERKRTLRIWVKQYGYALIEESVFGDQVRRYDDELNGRMPDPKSPAPPANHGADGKRQKKLTAKERRIIEDAARLDRWRKNSG